MGNAQVENTLRYSNNLVPESALPLFSDPWCWPKGSQPLGTRLLLEKRLRKPSSKISIQPHTFITHTSISFHFTQILPNKPWTRSTRSNTYNLGPEHTVKRRNHRRLNAEYRSKWVMTYRLTVLSSSFFHFSPATLDSSVTEMPGCSCLICARASFSHSMYADSDRLGAFASFLVFFFLLPSGFSA